VSRSGLHQLVKSLPRSRPSRSVPWEQPDPDERVRGPRAPGEDPRAAGGSCTKRLRELSMTVS
jgi:hypothetical protein